MPQVLIKKEFLINKCMKGIKCSAARSSISHIRNIHRTLPILSTLNLLFSSDAVSRIGHSEGFENHISCVFIFSGLRFKFLSDVMRILYICSPFRLMLILS